MHRSGRHHIDNDVLHVRQHENLLELFAQFLFDPIGDVREPQRPRSNCGTRL